jgi:hypothetical protein
MSDIAMQAVGLALLLVTTAGAYWLGLKRLAGAPGRDAKLALAFVAATGAGGLSGALPWWLGVEHSFAWQLSPLTGRMLAAASLSFALICLLTVLRPERDRLRLVSLAVLVYLLPLGLAIAAAHLGRFDPDAPITYGFFIVVGVLLAGAARFLLWPAWPAGAAFISAARPWETGFLAVLALVAGLWGAALFAGMRLNLPGMPGVVYDLLGARLIATMFLTMAAVAVLGIAVPRLAGMALTMIAAYGLGASAASLWSLALGERLPVAYLVFWGGAGALAIALLLVRRRG